MRQALLSAGAGLCLLFAGAPAMAAGMDDLVAAAKKEGALTVIALPRDWCGYGALIDSFKAKYGIAVNELNPDGGSGDEVEAIKANKDNKGPQAPDVIDVGLSFGPAAKAEGLLQPYKVSTWDTIPDAAKDADGYWTGDYYGVLSFAVNSDIVKTPPADWSDLLKPEFKASVALAGDPRTSNQATMGVYAAGLSGGATDAAKAAEDGLNFFAELNKKGNFVPAIGKAASIAQGETPVLVFWDYNALAARDNLKGNPKVDVIVPKTGVVAGVYVQAISAYAPHPERRQALARAPLFGRGPDRLAQGLLPPDPLQQPGRDQEGASRRARRAAAGGELRQGEVSDARRAEGRQRGHRQAVGRRRRRDGREVRRRSRRIVWSKGGRDPSCG